MASHLLGDLNDFISPSQACIKPVPSKADTFKATEKDAEISVVLDLEPVPDTVTISLNDCLACSGCITSAESVLVSQQTYLQLYTVLEANKEALLNGLSKPQLVVVSVSPQSRTAIAARYNISSYEAMLRITQFLKNLGVDYVFDTVLARDISLYECSREFVEFYNSKASSGPLIAGACPGWICYAEKTQPQLIENISRTKSPQQIMGTLIKHFYASKVLSQNIRPNHIFHVTVMPCYDKKLEASRPDFFDETFQSRDVDCVIATSELVKMLDENVADAFCNMNISTSSLDSDLSLLSDQGNLLNHGGSGSGGYLEHVLRFACKQIFNIDIIFDERGQLILSPLFASSHALLIENQRNSDFQEISVVESTTGQCLLRFAKVYGFRNVQTLVRKMKSKRTHYDYVEVMACPGACLNGGGQPRPDTNSGVTPLKNLEHMYNIYNGVDRCEPLISPKIEMIYREWLGGHSSPLLRTSFRAVEKSLPTSNFSVQW